MPLNFASRLPRPTIFDDDEDELNDDYPALSRPQSGLTAGIAPAFPSGPPRAVAPPPRPRAERAPAEETLSLEQFAAQARKRYGVPDEVAGGMKWRTPRKEAAALGLDSSDPFHAVAANYKHLARLASENGGDWSKAAAAYGRQYAALPAPRAPVPRVPQRQFASSVQEAAQMLSGSSPPPRQQQPQRQANVTPAARPQQQSGKAEARAEVDRLYKEYNDADAALRYHKSKSYEPGWAGSVDRGIEGGIKYGLGYPITSGIWAYDKLTGKPAPSGGYFSGPPRPSDEELKRARDEALKRHSEAVDAYQRKYGQKK